MLAGIVAYGVFAFYILVACVKGSITFAGRFFMISVRAAAASPCPRPPLSTHARKRVPVSACLRVRLGSWSPVLKALNRNPLVPGLLTPIADETIRVMLS